MSKKDKVETSAAMIPGLENVRLTASSSKDRMEALRNLLGGEPGSVEAIASGKLPFWPAGKDLVLCGTIESRREFQGKKNADNPTGMVGVYTLLIQKQECAAGTTDGEVFLAQPGERIQVLERAIMKDWRQRIGQTVAVVCEGKKPTKSGNEYWDYLIVGTKMSTSEIERANALAGAKPLPSGSVSEGE